jgi:hypothetical protein
MTPAEFAASIPDFGKLNITEKIKRFSWYLAVHEDKSPFAGLDVIRCFQAAKYPKPSSITSFLRSLADQNSPFLLTTAGGYCLSQFAHDELDSVLGHRKSTVTVHKLLEDLPRQLAVECQKVYLEEALICFRNKAFRAAVVMTWNVAFDHLCNVIVKKALPGFNTQLPKVFPKAEVQVINGRDDFEGLKEHQVLQVAKSASIITGSVHKILKEKLDRRNIAAHPSGVAITQLQAEDFITDLIQNAVLKL